MIKRVKELRKNLKLSQADFGKRIGLTRDNIANIEGGRAEIKDVFIKSVCRDFNVNEAWLRTGEGEMFNDHDDIAEVVSEIMEKTNPLYAMIVDMVKAYTALDEPSKAAINNLMAKLRENVKSSS